MHVLSIVALSSLAPLQEAPAARAPFRGEVRVLHTFVGEAAGDQFGWEGRRVGDCDGDGTQDLVLSAPSHASAAGANAGKVYVYSGATGRLLFAREGVAGEWLGLGIEAAGDVDADGRADVIAGSGAGNAYVHSGRSGAEILRLSAAGGGGKVAGAGDLDGDGHADLLVGAPQNDEAGTDAGRVLVFSGKDGRELLVLDGEEPGDRFGDCVAGAGTGTSKSIVVGAPDAGPGDRGRVYVFDLARGDAELAFTIEAEPSGTNLGRMFLSLVGDVDADGVLDVYASDWEDGALGPSTGRVYIHSGKTAKRLFLWTGEHVGDGFGIGPAQAGDADGDGHADLVLGAWQNDEGAEGAGKAYLLSGKDGRELATWVCTQSGDTFGFDATGVGDLDGDGAIDFLITSAWSGVAGPRSGRAFVIAGPKLGAAQGSR